MRPWAIVALGVIALTLMLLNLYGIYELIRLFTRIGRIDSEKEMKLRGEEEIHDSATTSEPEVTTTKHHRLKYQFNRTTGSWDRRPVETTTIRQRPTTTIHHRPRKPSTKYYYVQQETTAATTEATTTTSTFPPWQQEPEIRHPIVFPQEESTTRSTTRMPFRINTVKITTHREDLTTHHQRHHEHRQHHRHHEHTTTTTTPISRTTTIYTHRNSMQWHHDRHRTSHHPTTHHTTTTTTTTTTSTTTTTEAPRPTTIFTHRPHHHTNNEIIDADEGILIEREDLIGEKNDDYDIIMPPIHVTRGDNRIPTTSSSPQIVIDDEGVRDVIYDDSEEEIEVTSYRPTTTTNAEDDDSGLTVVTALMDIGRGEWFEYRRPLEKYHSYMENLLSLKVNMIIFTDKSSVDFVYKYRKEMGLMKKTKVYNITLDDLPLARYHFHAQKIIEDELKTPELWRKWDPQMQKHPEAKSPEYDILVNSKTYFLYNATLEDPFSSDWFVWLDAGYGHGDQTPFPVDNHWRPQFPRRKISVIKITPEHDQMTNWSLDKLYRQNWSVISGGFLAGERHAIGQLHTLVHRKFVELINMDRVDDDQTVLVLVIQSHPHLFNIVTGDWFDAFNKFPSIK
ncbi:hypothetical protein PFISCL1PPCAC_1728 [Pristionchus fissidentatus]|uniref:Uncharacterized protein n=1 Tax=Pristionchus fissidentatus TaxID=1538716 RepID=A0AAV5UV95_9BILA|nr:hypothetical protein PFISCL1PPCAC_1728 [Pristionchus fissidentatus]